MSATNQIPFEPVLNTLNTVVVAAFATMVANEKPRLVMPADSVVIEPVNVEVSIDSGEATGSKTGEVHTYAIIVRVPMPTASGNPSKTIPKVKMQMANTLRAAIQVPGLWKNIANYPYCTKYIWPDVSPQWEGYIEMQALFRCQTGTPFY